MTARDARSAWLFLAFPLTVIVVFTALPTLAGVILSFFEWTGSGPPRFIGLQNYQAAFARDPQLRFALRNTMLFMLATVPLTTLLAFLLAAALHARWFRLATLTRTIVFIPTVISIVGIGFIWRWILDPQAGALNAALSSMRAERLFGDAGLPLWLGDNPWALAAIIGVHVWRNVGFGVVLYLAAMSRIPHSLHEAASIDGAGGWRALWRITWPGVRPTTIFLVITGAIWSLQVFDLVWVLTGGSEQRWTDVLNTTLYREFAANRLGYAATIGVIVLVLSALVTMAQWRWFERRGHRPSPAPRPAAPGRANAAAGALA